MNTTEPIIRVKDLVLAFGNFKAVDGISFEVKQGEIFGFLGANGAGKTTTIRVLCGILNPTSGQVQVEGKDVSSSTAVLKPRIGYMSQKFTLYPDLTVRENMAFAGSLYNMTHTQIQARSKELFEFIGLSERLDGPVKELSGGVKQMVALSATLLQDPSLVFLDEPTAGTSVQTRQRFWELIKLLAARGKTVFVTTHYMDEAEYCSRIALMDRGQIVALGTPDELKVKFFPSPPLELSFIRPVQRQIRQQIEAQQLGEVAVFGELLHVRTDYAEKFAVFATTHAGDFTYQTVKPTLEDVFLKAVSGRSDS